LPRQGVLAPLVNLALRWDIRLSSAICDCLDWMVGVGMNGDADGTIVTAVLPSGVPVRIEVAGSGSGDGMASVGLQALDLAEALDRVGEIGSLVVEKLRAARPAKATVELRLGFAVESGKLTALWVGGKGEASLTVTLEWSHPDAVCGRVVEPSDLTSLDGPDESDTSRAGGDG
jgi:hypothetical protein